MKRREFLLGSAALILAPILARAAEGNTFEVSLSESEWQQRLTDLEFKVMRAEGTERAFSSPLNAIKAEGVYHCKGCDLALYDSAKKFESGTGWPSFWDVIPNAVATKPDPGLFGTRTEEHCSRCGSHMGHVFSDGPQPTGLRHCINGVSLVFRPADGGEPIRG